MSFSQSKVDYIKKIQAPETLPHHKFIYGALVDPAEICEVEPFKKYYLPLYGNPHSGECIIGFEYNRVYGLYDNLHYSYTKLNIVDNEVPNDIITLFEKCYPNLKGTTHAIIQDVYTSHYASGVIMCGYWILNEYDYVNDELFDISMKETFLDNLTIHCLGHNMKDCPSQYFIGRILSHLSSNEAEDNHHDLAEELSQTYTQISIPSKDKILSELHKISTDITISIIPSIVLLQTMCYCCT